MKNTPDASLLDRKRGDKMPQKRNKKAPAPSSSKSKSVNKSQTVRVRNQSVEEKKKSAPKKAPQDKRADKEQETLVPRSSKLVHQIIPFALFVLVLLTIVCFIEKSWLGLFGKGFHSVLFGLFGYGAYAIPALLVYLAIFWRDLVDKKLSIVKVVLAVLIVIFLSALLQVCIYSAKGNSHPTDVKTLFFRGELVLGGGVVGGYVAFAFDKIFSVVGTIIVASAIVAVLSMLFVNVTPAYIAKKIREIRKKKAQIAAKQKEAQAKEKQETAVRRETHKEFVKEDAPEQGKGTKTPKQKKEKQTEPEKKTEKELYLDPTAAFRADKNKQDDGVDFDESPFDDPKRERTVKEEPQEQYQRAVRVMPERENSYSSADNTVSEKLLHDEIIDSIDGEQPQKNKDADPSDEESAENLNAIPLDEGMEQTFKQNIRSVKRVVVDDEETQKQMDEIFGSDSRFQAKREKANSINEDGEYDGLADEEDEDDILEVEVSAEEKPVEEEEKPYVFPPIDLLNIGERSSSLDEDALNENMNRLEDTLASFRIRIREMTYSCGPTITRYELKPEAGIRVRSIANLVDDIAMSLATTGVRIEAPIPGKAAVGIEVPNPDPSTVYLRGLIDSPKFRDAKSRITACLGEDVTGNPIIFDIGKMPHLLVAGATGMGKSVCINSIILSLLYKATPKELKLILIDPKKVEFNIYKDIPHLFSPIVSDPKKAAAALVGAVNEMEQRFALIEEVGVRDIAHYNAATANDPEKPFMPHMVIIIDELADLMMTAPDEVESSICRLAQKARAAGIHIIIGTQRPSVDVITGLIKANIPSRIAFTVASQVDSRTIIDIAGAEKLIGRGDMLYAPVGSPKPARVQGAFVSEKEVEAVVEYIKAHNGPVKYNENFVANLDKNAQRIGATKKELAAMDDEGGASPAGDGEDPKLLAAIELAVETGKISTSLMQRRLEVGYGRAAKIIDRMEELGYVSAPDGNKPRKILITKEDLMEMTVRGTNE